MLHAVQSAYQELIAEGLYPFAILFIDIDPSQIDINVHPTKHEIKFEEERLIYNFLKVAVKHAIGKFAITHSWILKIQIGVEKLITHQGSNSNFSNQRVVSSNTGSKASWEDLAFPKQSSQKYSQALFNPFTEEKIMNFSYLQIKSSSYSDTQ